MLFTTLCPKPDILCYKTAGWGAYFAQPPNHLQIARTLSGEYWVSVGDKVNYLKFASKVFEFLEYPNIYANPTKVFVHYIISHISSTKFDLSMKRDVFKF